MNRLQFLAELRKSLIDTTKGITFPVISEEIEKLDEVADQIVGIQWFPLKTMSPSSFLGAQDRFINNRSILFFSDGKSLKAYEKKCISCNCLAQWITYEKKLKCFSCDKTYDVQKDSGELKCERHSMKETNGEWFIGLKSQ